MSPHAARPVSYNEVPERLWKEQGMPERWVLPEGSPLYPTLPYVYEQYRRLSVYFRAPEEAVRQILPAPLEYVSDVAEAFILSVPQVSGLVPYSEGGIVVTARYRDIVGGHVAYEYVENDDSLAAGREIWGYPKKLAAVGYREGGERVEGSLRRRGVRILNAEAVLDGSPIQPPGLLPRLVVRRIPRVDGPGLVLGQVILNDPEARSPSAALAVATSPSKPPTGTRSTSSGRWRSWGRH